HRRCSQSDPYRIGTAIFSFKLHDRGERGATQYNLTITSRREHGMTIEHLSLDQFLSQLSSNTPTPGGGSAASLMGAIGAALVGMVCNLTTGKDQYAAVESRIQNRLATAQDLQAQITATIADDIAAFDQVMAAFRLPRVSDEETAARHRAIQAALIRATQVPMRCARLCGEVLALSGEVAEIGNLKVISDAGVAAMAAYAGLKSAALNVYINVPNLTERDFATRCIDEIERLCATADQRVAATYALVRSKL
ncbi:MAG: cyclodeaminase/cyclohydrolase family protein, partial [Gammaproteobacteria bacterium]